MEVFESHSGADTMPFEVSEAYQRVAEQYKHTALYEDVDALLHKQRSVEDNQAVAQRQHIIAGAHLEKGPDRTLYHAKFRQRQSYISFSSRVGCRSGA